MISKHFKLTRLFAEVAAIAVLAGCGGGGSSNPAPAPAAAPVAQAPVVQAPVAAPAPAPAPAAVNPDLVTSVSAATYAAGSTEKGAWDVLNAQRSACGFGLLQQDTRLDVASYNHAYYMVQNSLDKHIAFIGHFEDPSYPYFTGNSPFDRTTFTGFPGNVLEIVAGKYSILSQNRASPYTAGEAIGADSMRSLIETVYHARGVFWAGRAGGVGSMLASGPSAQAGFNQHQFRLVSKISNEADANKQKLGTGNIASWPCAGLTGVGGTFPPANESPNPFPEITDTSVKYGTPIYFKADADSVLVVSSAMLTKVSDGSVLALRQLTKANDPAAVITDNEVFLVPTTALARATSYAVHAVGTLNGAAFTRDFTFSTAP